MKLQYIGHLAKINLKPWRCMFLGVCGFGWTALEAVQAAKINAVGSYDDTLYSREEV